MNLIMVHHFFLIFYHSQHGLSKLCLERKCRKSDMRHFRSEFLGNNELIMTDYILLLEYCAIFTFSGERKIFFNYLITFCKA